MTIQRKSIGLCIVLSIVTCGIYSLYWLYCMAEDVNLVTARPSAPSGGLVLLLTIVTCGLWSIISFIQGILMLTMTQQDFENKYVLSTSTFPIF